MAGLSTTGCYYAITVLLTASVVLSSNEDWIQHNARVEMFVCRIPQARGYTFEHLVEENGSIQAIIGSVYPTQTVLHRCQQAGCCKGKKGCLPTSMDEIKLIFAVTSFDLKPTVRYVEVTTTNHTRCACQNKKDKPKK